MPGFTLPKCLVVLGLVLAACAHRPTPSRIPAEQIRSAPIDVPATEAAKLAAWAQGDGRSRALRLDRLIDLLDGARFAQDRSARETLWLALGGHETGRGPAATADAISRLVSEAMELSDRADTGLSDELRTFVNDAIQMLTTDLRHSVTAEDQAIGLGVYRSLATNGHPWLKDNARWRLYDHVRGTLQAAVQRPPGRRIEIAIQALYAEREDLNAELGDAPPGEAPPWIGPAPLVELLRARLDALATDPRWQHVVAPLAAADRELAATLAALLPAPRDAQWKAPVRPRGTAQPDALLPVVLLEPGKASVDAGRPESRTYDLTRVDTGPLADAITAMLAQDGRGRALLVGPGNLPAPELARVFRALRRARVSAIDLALWEPHTSGRRVLTTLPLYMVQDTEPGVQSQVFSSSRIRLDLRGVGLDVWVDGNLKYGTATTEQEIRSILTDLAAAFPRTPYIALTTGNDVALEQLIDTMINLVGGPKPLFTAAGWLPATPPVPDTSAPLEPLLLRRLDRLRTHGDLRLSQPFPLVEADQQRLDAFVTQLSACVPELQDMDRRSQPRVELHLGEGHITEVRVDGLGRRDKPTGENLRACVREQGLSLRLRHHRDAMVISIEFGPQG